MSSLIDPTHSGTRSSQALQTQLGQRYTLLDSVRDTNFLSKSSTDGLGNNISDMGLGVVDNGLFVYTTKFTPGSPTVPRPYPVKFFWIGSPAGTTDANDNFAIFCADVNQSAFYPGAPASAWLLNPRLVLSYQQAKKDIVAWFDANYPGGGTNGVGNTGTGSNAAYGTLDGDNSHPGNVSGMNSIDGQFWPIYDYVDNSILLYFSVKTLNANTHAIYCYKITNSEIPSPITSTQFEGGAFPSLGFQSFNSLSGNVTSSHRFSITSPDPLVTQRVSNQQTAVLLLSGGPLDTSTPDHGQALQGLILSDIHTSPLATTNLFQTFPTSSQVDQQLPPVDKLGSIHACTPSGSESDGYAFLYNAPSQRDVRTGSNAVVISAMNVICGYWHPYAGIFSIGLPAVISLNEQTAAGICRPQYTTYPDGLPKILANTFNFDQSLEIVYQYIEPGILAPKNRVSIHFTRDTSPSGVTKILPSYGKRYCIYKTTRSASTTNFTTMLVRVLYYWFVDPSDTASLTGATFLQRIIASDQDNIAVNANGRILNTFIIDGLSRFFSIGPGVEGRQTDALLTDIVPIVGIDQKFGYLTTGGAAITTNSTPNLGFGSTGSLLSTTSSDWRSSSGFKELVLNFIIGTVSGTSPTLTIKFLHIDPLEGNTVQTLTLNSSAITTSNHQVKLLIANGTATAIVDGTATSLGAFNVPLLWQVVFTIGGTTPSFAVEGTYEMRK